MQLAPPLLLRRPTPLAAALRMLSPSSSLNPSANTRLVSREMKPIPTDSSCRIPISLPPLSNPRIALPNSQNFPQALTPFKCFSTTTSTNPITISNSSEEKMENCEASNDVVSPESPLVVVSFYKFADFPDHADLRKPLKELCERLVIFCFALV